MRNLLEKSSVAQSLDGEPSGGEPAYPRVFANLVPLVAGRKWRSAAHHSSPKKYFFCAARRMAKASWKATMKTIIVFTKAGRRIGAGAMDTNG
jgi:hypothetical protein